MAQKIATESKTNINNESSVEVIDTRAMDNELVTFRAFKDNNKYRDDITVAVNGKIFRIQRGVEVKIPRYVFNVLKRSMEQDDMTQAYISEISK